MRINRSNWFCLARNKYDWGLCRTPVRPAGFGHHTYSPVRRVKRSVSTDYPVKKSLQTLKLSKRVNLPQSNLFLQHNNQFQMNKHNPAPVLRYLL